MTVDEMQGQIDELTRQLQQARDSQGGSDREVSRLKAELAATTANADTKDTAATLEATLTVRKDLLDRRERALGLAIEKGIDPQQAFKLLGLDGDQDDETILDNLVAHDEEIVKKAKTEFRIANGRERPHRSVRLQMEPPTLADLAKLAPDQLARVSGATLDQAIAADRKANTTTRRQAAERDLLGGLT